MYHFILIDEASTEADQISSAAQKEVSRTALPQSEISQNLLKKTAKFLHQYIDQPNCCRIFISKN